MASRGRPIPGAGAGRLLAGTGAPEGTVTGDAAGHFRLFQRRDGGPRTTLYVQESGAGTTVGWVAE